MKRKKNKLHDFVLGMVIMALLVALAVPALAVTGRKQMEVDNTDIHLHVDGIPVSASPFASGGTTYLPVRAVGEALGMDVRWDGPTHTVYITDPTEPSTTNSNTSSTTVTGKQTIDVDYLDIKLVVNGKEVTPKDVNGNVVEPFAYNGTTYLPVRAVGEALGKTVRWDGETKTVHLGELPQATYLVDVCKVNNTAEEKVYRVADQESFFIPKLDGYGGDNKWHSQGFPFNIHTAPTFELGGKYESLTFDVFTYSQSDMIEVYFDGKARLIQIGGIEPCRWQTVTVPLNYAQTLRVQNFNRSSTKQSWVANAVLNGERTVAKPVPPTNATYLVDACTTNAESYKYKAADGKYWEDVFGNKYTNGVIPNLTVQLNGRYKTLKATVVKNIWGYNESSFKIYVDGKAVEGIKVSDATYPSTIEIPLNYGMELRFDDGAIDFLADAILE